MKIAISLTTESVVLDLANYAAQIPKATVRAMNRAIGSGRTVMVREVARDAGMKAKDVRDRLILREATWTRLEASLTASMKRIPLIEFNARGPEPSRGRGRGVTARLPGGAGRYPNAFIATMGAGHRGVYQRRGSGRLPIRELFGPSIGHVFAKYRALGVAKVNEAFLKNFDHELVFAGATAPPEASGSN